MVMFAEEHTEEERREVSRKVLKTWRQNSSRRAQNSDSPLLLSEERHAEEKERERERERVEFGERATTEYPQTHAKNVRVRFRVENLSLETSPD